MTKFTFGLLAFAFITSSAFAQGVLKCDLKIADNDPDCPWIGSCPQKNLKVSRKQLILELNDGDVQESEIELVRVVMLDKKDKEKKGVKLVVFKDDANLAKLKENKVKHISYKYKDSVEYHVQKHGDSYKAIFSSPQNKLEIRLEGDYSVQDYLLTSEHAIAITCSTMRKAIFDEEKAKEEALKEYKKQKDSGVTKQ